MTAKHIVLCINFPRGPESLTEQALRKWEKAEESARHGLFVFLLLFTLVGMDIMSKKTRVEQQQTTQTWVAWGVTFVLWRP